MHIAKVKAPAILVDIDGTLANNTHRQHHLDKRPKDWKSFFEGAHLDVPNDWCETLIEAMQVTHAILYVSGRHEDYRQVTESWIRQHLHDYSIKLFMRASGDSRDDTVVKREIYEEYIAPEYDVAFCVDDRPKVARMWRDIGLVCLQCNDKEF